MDDILTVQEVAAYLKLSRATVWRWCNDGTLPAFKVGRSWRVQRSAVEKITTTARPAVHQEALVPPTPAPLGLPE